MKKLKLTKVIASALVVALVLVLNPIGVSAEWKHDSTGWWYTEGNSWATGWRNIQGKWYYFDSSYGYMVHDTTVDGYYLSSSGAWITNLPNSANQSDFIFNSIAGIITGYNGKDSTLIIPSLINGVPVKEIGENAFENNLKIVSVTIPDSVTIIGRCAFEGCSNLKSVTIPLSVKEVNSESFKWCSNLTNINADRITADCIKKNNAYYEKLKNTITSQSSPSS